MQVFLSVFFLWGALRGYVGGFPEKSGMPFGGVWSIICRGPHWGRLMQGKYHIISRPRSYLCRSVAEDVSVCRRCSFLDLRPLLRSALVLHSDLKLARLKQLA